MYSKVCEICNTPFTTHNKNKRCCTQSCSNKLMWKENRNKMIEKFNDPQVRKNNSKKQKEKWKDTKHKEKMHKIKKEIANREESKKAFVKRLKKWQKDNKEDYLKQRKEISNRDSVKEAISQFQKKLWQDEKYREEQREKFSKGQLKRWSNVENMIKFEQLSHGKYKDYSLPSGRVVKVQGYEPQALDFLLESFSESDIIIGVANINKEIGKITYLQNEKEHRYYPDFYIKSINTIIEVKSQWTYDNWRTKNELKRQACLDKGFNFEFMIL